MKRLPAIRRLSNLDRDWARQPLTCARLEREPPLAVARAVQGVATLDVEQEAIFVADTIETMRRQNPDFVLPEHRGAVSQPL